MRNKFSVTLTERDHEFLFDHLIRSDGQEDLCFATYNQSKGSTRFTGIISNLIFPNDGERMIHGNVGFLPEYFERVLKIASEKKEGIAFLHSHPFPGWQGMSKDDIIAEKRIAPACMSVTNLPLLGLTLGNDGSWSGRFWTKNINKKRIYSRRWCESVRVIGKNLKITYNKNLLKPRTDINKQLRTISAWGLKTQEIISQLRIGIVGLGSVGSMVSEILARTGFSNFTLIDFDMIEEKNLDRTMNACKKDIGRTKVDVIKKAILKSSTSSKTDINFLRESICKENSFREILNCDVIFCCVDRPLPRQVLNFISYVHLIPVIDGGIFVRTNRDNSKLIGADWKTTTVGFDKQCLECLGQYTTENAVLEKGGFLDDPTYIAGVKDKNRILKSKENVFVFSCNLASLEVFQLLTLLGVAYSGLHNYHFVSGILDNEFNLKCHANCFFKLNAGKGENVNVIPYT